MDVLLYIGAGLLALNFVMFGVMWVVYMIDEKDWRHEHRKRR